MNDFVSLLKLDARTFVLSTIKSPLVPSFVLDLLLQKLVKEKRHVLLILLAQNVKHYSAVLAKSGHNLKQSIENGIIQTIDTFDYDFGQQSDNDKIEYFFDYDRFKMDIQSKLSDLKDNSVVIIDDIHVLHTLECSIKKTYLLMRKLITTTQVKQSSLFIGTAHLNRFEKKWNSLVTNLAYECDILIECDEPNGGYSSRINGLTKYSNKKDETNKEFNYKLSNRGVVFNKLN